MNNYDKFIGKLYDILLDSDIISYDDKAHDLKEKKERLEDYLKKLDRVQSKAVSKNVHIDTLKRLYYDKYIIKKENIPESYFKSLEKRYLDEGYGHHNLVSPDNETDKRLKEDHINTIIREQKDSLDAWLNYFLSKDSDYLPMWAKVWAFQGMLGIGNLNKEKDGYGRRGSTSVNPFVNLDSEVLGKCIELIKETFDNKEVTDKEIEKLIASGSFSKLYGKLLANKKQLKVVSDDGIWIKYNYESEEEANEKLKDGIEPEYLKLYNSLQGYNTGWCTAGSKETAKEQICGGDSYQGGDFYVFYTKDKDNEYKIPRIAIRMDKEKIGEIRGVAENQNIESNMEKVLEEKLKEFPDGKLYQKKVYDMKLLTEIYDNYEKRELTQEELIFLYEINDEISGFGFRRDPRINEILKSRDKRQDLSIALNCKPSQIGFTKDDLFCNQLLYYDGTIDFPEYQRLKKLNYKLPKYIRKSLHLGLLKTVEDLTLPQSIGGTLNLGGLISAKELVLPQTVGGSLKLNELTTAEGLTLPQNIGGDLYLNELTTAEGLTLPQNIGGDLYLVGLTTAEGLHLPQNIGENLYLSSLTTAEDLHLPQNIDGDLYLDSLTTVKDLKFPQNIGGTLYLSNLTIAEDLTLPQSIGGSLFLDGLRAAEGLTFPQSIGGILYLDKLTIAKDLKLPQSIGVSLVLYGLTTAEGLTLPQSIDGSLNLGGLTTAESLKLPQSIGGSLNLSGLTTAEGLHLPQNIGGNLDLSSLTTAEGLHLPQNIGGNLDLSSLTTAEGLTFPQSIGKNLNLGGLTTTEGLHLPRSIGGNLDLSSLTTAEGLHLPRSIGGNLYLDGLTTTIGLTLPDEVGGQITYNYGASYSLEKLKELQQEEIKPAKKVKINNNKLLNHNRKGFTTVVLTFALMSVITLISIVIAILLLNW